MDYNENELIDRISEFMRINRISDDPSQSLIAYYHGHRPKFQKGIEWICDVCRDTRGNALELGSRFPYYSYFLGMYQRWTVKCVDICTVRDYVFPDAPIFVTYGNLHFYDLGKELYDLVIISEVIEHLACNLLSFRDRLIRSVKHGGYLFVSYPLGGLNSDPTEWDKEYDMVNFDPGPHKREFREDTWSSFIDLPVIKAENVSDPLYSNIKVVLYSRP